MLVATALTDTVAPEDITYAWLGAITKVERDKDGNALVYGKVTDGTVDSDEQIVDPVFAKKALAEWYETGANVRQMHATSLPPAGKGILLESMPDGEYVRTKVVEPTAIKLVDNDVYTGYSVGISRPRIERDSKARGGRIVGGKIVEISLVDRPANPMAKFAVLKASGGRGLAFIGKSVTVPAAYRPAKATKIADVRVGSRVSVDVSDEFGGVSTVRGRLAARGHGSIAIDEAGFTRDGVVKRLQETDVVAVRRGTSAGTLTATKAAGVTHTHMHAGPDGIEHDHEHTHAPNHGDHSQSHAHAHPEDSVADDQPADTGTTDGPAATKAGDKCTKCGGSGKVEGDKCASCGGTGSIMTKAKGKAKPGAPEVDPGPDAATTAPGRDVGQGEPEVDPGPDAATTAPSRDTAPGEPEVDPGPDADDKTKAAKPKKALKVVQSNGQWAVQKGDKVLGTHPTEEAAKAHRDAIKAERKAAKVAAKKSAKKSAKTSPKVDGTPETPWLVRRLHDYTCGAYKTADVSAAYPTVEKGGIASAVSPTARAAVYALLADAVMRDGGTGSGSGEIASLGKALGAINDILATKADTTTAREEVVEAFKFANGLTQGEPTGIPKPSESITPGQFRRGYLSSGHQTETASAKAPNIPTTTHPVRATDFGRGAVTEGHQRYLASKLADLHDGLADWRPEICLMDANGSMAFDRQMYPGLGDRPPFVGGQVFNGDTNSPRAITPPAPSGQKVDGTTAPVRTLSSDVVPEFKTFTPEDFDQALTKALEPHLNKIASLERTVEQLAASPDTSRSAPRGVTRTTDGKVEKVSHVGEAAREARKGRKAERIEYLTSLAGSGDPAQRIAAQEQLSRLGVDFT